MIVTGSEVTVN